MGLPGVDRGRQPLQPVSQEVSPAPGREPDGGRLGRVLAAALENAFRCWAFDGLLALPSRNDASLRSLIGTTAQEEIHAKRKPRPHGRRNATP